MSKLRSFGRAAAAALLIGDSALLATPTTASAKDVPAPMNVTPLAGQFHPIVVAGSPGPGCFTRYLRGAVECA
jgi:hypothetical protein